MKKFRVLTERDSNGHYMSFEVEASHFEIKDACLLFYNKGTTHSFMSVSIGRWRSVVEVTK